MKHSVSNGKRHVSNVNKRAKMFAVCAWTQIAVNIQLILYTINRYLAFLIQLILSRYTIYCKMSVQIKILYGPEYDRCKTSTMSTESLKKLNLERLYNVVQETVGTYYRDSKTLRIQYRDDEGTFVTITNERDVKDAARSCKTVPHEETKIIRLCLRVDDSCTPVGNASIARRKFAHPSPPEKRPRTTVDSRKKLSFDYDQEDEIQTNSERSH